MQSSVLLISRHDRDRPFWKSVAEANQLGFREETDPSEIEALLSAFPKTIVIWDAEAPALRALESLLIKYARPEHTFAVTNEVINQSPELFRPPAFAHHVYRRYDSLANILCNRLIEKLLAEDPFGFLNALPGVTATHQVTLKNSAEKQQTVENLSQFLEAQGVISKLSRLAADAIDELIMNAIFDAPWTESDGYYRRTLDRAASFDLAGRESVEIDISVTKDLVGIKVTDHFGSLRREQILKSLGKNLKTSAYDPPVGDPGAGLGIHKINQSSMTLVFASKPQVRTEVLVVFPNTQSYREMKLGFCCFSVVCN
jgi:hypothetical protein